MRQTGKCSGPHTIQLWRSSLQPFLHTLRRVNFLEMSRRVSGRWKQALGHSCTLFSTTISHQRKQILDARHRQRLCAKALVERVGQVVCCAEARARRRWGGGVGWRFGSGLESSNAVYLGRC
jgi:hypothetical protein